MEGNTCNRAVDMNRLAELHAEGAKRREEREQQSASNAQAQAVQNKSKRAVNAERIAQLHEEYKDREARRKQLAEEQQQKETLKLQAEAAKVRPAGGPLSAGCVKEAASRLHAMHETKMIKRAVQQHIQES